MTTYTPFDSLKYAVAKATEFADTVTAMMNSAEPISAVQEVESKNFLDGIERIRTNLTFELDRWTTPFDRHRYSDGRPTHTSVELEAGISCRVLWPVDPGATPGDPHDVELPSGRIATISYTPPSTIEWDYTGWWKVATDV